MTGEEKKHEVGKEDLEKKDCPLSPTAWILFLSGEIYNEESTNNQDSTTPTTTLLVVVALSIIALIFAVETTDFPANTINNILSVLLLALSIFIILIFIYLGILLSQFLARLLIPSETRKRVQALKKLRREIISGKKDSNNIRDEWEEIDRTLYPRKKKDLEKSKNEQKELKEDEGNSKMVKIIKIFFGCVFVALLIAPAMLVAPFLSVAPYILGISVLFAVAYVLEDKLKKSNNGKAISQKITDRFGDVLIGIISGLVASYLMWVLLTFGEISISLLFLVFPMLIASLAVAYTMVVVWEYGKSKIRHNK